MNAQIIKSNKAEQESFFIMNQTIARADMLVKCEGAQANNIRYGATISEDRFAHEEFDFMLSNPAGNDGLTA